MTYRNHQHEIDTITGRFPELRAQEECGPPMRGLPLRNMVLVFVLVAGAVAGVGMLVIDMMGAG